MIQCKNMKKAEEDFAQKNPVYISAYSHMRDREQNKGDSEQDAGSVVEQASSGFSKSMEDTGQGGIGVQKWTDKRNRSDVRSGGGAVKKKFSDKRSGKEKEKGTYGSQQHTS